VAESWIKMRGSLMTNPKVIKMARLLLQDPEFLAWFAHDGVTLDASQAVTRRHVTVVTRVTVGALTPLWAQVNECAGTDFVLPDASLFEVDEMAGVPGFGRALEGVAWLRVLPDSKGVEFPNFIEHNTVGKERSTGAKTQAERAKEYRERAKQKALEGVTNSVTEKSDASRDGVTTEKSREEKKHIPPTPKGVRFAEFWSAWPNTDRKTRKADCEKKWITKGCDAVANRILAHVEACKGTRKWQEGFEPAPMTYLNGLLWQDGDGAEQTDLLSGGQTVNRV
jgi:hypothetical protein